MAEFAARRGARGIEVISSRQTGRRRAFSWNGSKRIIWFRCWVVRCEEPALKGHGFPALLGHMPGRTEARVNHGHGKVGRITPRAGGWDALEHTARHFAKKLRQFESAAAKSLKTNCHGQKSAPAPAGERSAVTGSGSSAEFVRNRRQAHGCIASYYVFPTIFDTPTGQVSAGNSRSYETLDRVRGLNGALERSNIEFVNVRLQQRQPRPESGAGYGSGKRIGTTTRIVSRGEEPSECRGPPVGDTVRAGQQL